MLNTLGRAGEVLDLFTDRVPEWGPTAVARELGVAKSQAHELLSSLAGIGLLSRTPAGRYRLGWRVLSLSASLMRSSDLQMLARPSMSRLSRQLDETVHLAVLDRTNVVAIAQQFGRLPIPGSVSSTGSQLQPHCTALGKALLAHRPEMDAVEMVRRYGFPRHTSGTIVSMDGFLQELRAVRAEGFAHDRSELMDGLRCVATPIRDANGDVVAALALSVAARRWSVRGTAYMNALVRSAKEISRGLNEPQLEAHAGSPSRASP